MSNLNKKMTKKTLKKLKKVVDKREQVWYYKQADCGRGAAGSERSSLKST